MYRTYTVFLVVIIILSLHNMLIILVFISMHYEMLKCESQWNKIKNKTLKTIFLFWPSYSSHSVSNRSQISNLGSWLPPSNRKRNHNWAFLLEFPNCLLGRNNLSNFTGPISRLRELQVFSRRVNCWPEQRDTIIIEYIILIGDVLFLRSVLYFW